MAPYFNSEIVPIEEVPQADILSGPGDTASKTSPLILVVDDEPLVADTVSLVLAHAGFRTLTAYNGRTALKLAMKARPQLLISDVAMGEMSGIQLAQSIMMSMPECKIMLFSGHTTFADLEASREAGFDFPLLTKPVHPTVMLKHVRAHLSHGGAGDAPFNLPARGMASMLSVAAD